MSQTVLIVDNDSSARLMLHQVLEEDGWLVTEAVDGVNALQLIEERRPDIVIMEAMLPQLNGIEVTKMLRDKVSTADLPIIMLSAFMRHAQEAVTAGVNKFLMWPLLQYEITQNIREVLSV